MENMDKGLTVPKWVLTKSAESTQMPQNLSAQAQKFGILMKKGFIGCPQFVDNTTEKFYKKVWK